MKFKHPCKECITRPICKQDCYILDSYVDQFQFNGEFILAIISLTIISLYFGLCYFTSINCLYTLPIVWFVALFIANRYKDDIYIEPNTLLEYLFIIILLIPISIMIFIVLKWEKYFNKYRPSMKGET